VKAHRETDKASNVQPLSELCTAVQGSCESLGRGKAYSCSLLTKRDTDNEESVHDMPVSLQLVARRLEEEKVLMMTEVILEAL
jgi:amidase